jgi:hypothetical protein
MNTWLRDNVDWSLKEQIFGYSDERLGLLIWSVPVVGGGSTRIAFHPESKAFTKLSGTFTAGIQKQVLQYPIIASSSGLQYASIETESAPECSLVSNPMDAGAPNMYKQWDYLLFAGTFGGLEVRIGYSDTEEGAVEWTAWKQVAREVPFTPRESIFLTIELRSIAGAAKWRISGITVFGEPAGFTV